MCIRDRDKYGVKPDIIIGCAGGGSNLGGLISPFMGEKLRGEQDYRFIAVEPASCPSLTRGKYVYDFCDTGKVCPLAKMYTLGSGFIPSANHAGGLRYHGMSSILSQLYDDGLMEAVSVAVSYTHLDVYKRQATLIPCAKTAATIMNRLPAMASGNATNRLAGARSFSLRMAMKKIGKYNAYRVTIGNSEESKRIGPSQGVVSCAL